jgi:hypothetical protein
MSQRYARVLMSRTCLQQPWSVVSALCPVSHLLCISFTHGCGSNCRRLLFCGLSGCCSVITGFLQQPTSSGAIQRRHCRCPGTGSTWHKSCLILTHACCTPLLLQACSGCSMGTGFAQQTAAHTECGALDTAVPGCPGTLRMFWVQRSCPTQGRLLRQCCSLVCDSPSFDHSPHCSSRAEHNLHKGTGGLGTLHIPNTLSAMLGNHRLLPASAGFSHLHCTVDACHQSSPWALAKVMADVEQFRMRDV